MGDAVRARPLSPGFLAASAFRRKPRPEVGSTSPKVTKWKVDPTSGRGRLMGRLGEEDWTHPLASELTRPPLT